MIRDGRDVALSFLNVEFGPTTLWDGAVFWRERVQSGRKFSEELPNGCYVEVRYEDLVISPHEVTNKVCSFLGEQFTASMLDEKESGEMVLHESHNLVLQKPNTSRIGKWKTDMSQLDLIRFESLNYDLLDKLGYEVFTRPGMIRRAKAALKAAITKRKFPRAQKHNWLGDKW
jgi:hypothetical protein